MAIRKLSNKAIFFSILMAIIVIVIADWGYTYATHSTPQKAQAAVNPTVGPFEIVPFAEGVVLITPSGDGNSFTAWYMKEGFWGWRVATRESAMEGLDPQNYNVDFEWFSMDGQTFVWGTVMRPIKKIVYRHNGKIYSTLYQKYPVWHMILPFAQDVFPFSSWTLVLPNGKVIPLAK